MLTSLPCRIVVPAILFIILLLPLTYILLTHTPTRIPLAIPHPETKATNKLLISLKSLNQNYKTISEEMVYSRYARVYSRKIQFPTGEQYSFDIWGRVWKNDSFSVVTIIPFDKKTQTFTLIREYNPAHSTHVYGFPQGMVELGSKHTNLQHAASKELEEEAHLKCRSWINLLDEHSGGVPQDKYQRENVFIYLCSDAVHMDHADGVDEEEEIEIIKGVTVSQVFQLSHAGVLQSNNIAAGLLAVDKLRQMRLLPSRIISQVKT